LKTKPKRALKYLTPYTLGGGAVELIMVEPYSLERVKREFNKVLLETIDEVVMFSQVILYFLELTSQFKREEIAERPEVFSSELESLFGEGASIIENRIIERLCFKLGIKYEEIEGNDFRECVRRAFREYLNLRKTFSH